MGLAVALGCHVDAPMYITDQEDMLSLMEQNVALNELESRVVPMVLNWLVVSPNMVSKRRSDLVLGGILSHQSCMHPRQRIS